MPRKKTTAPAAEKPEDVREGQAQEALQEGHEQGAAAPRRAAIAATTGETVTVALKHPTGIILEVFKPEPSFEPVLGGGMRETTIYRPTGGKFTLNGNRVPVGVAPPYPIVAGYALTHGIPRDVWEAWRAQHADHPLVQGNLIAAYKGGEDAAAFAEEHRETRSGMEPVRRKDDPRVPKRIGADGKFQDTVSIMDATQ